MKKLSFILPLILLLTASYASDTTGSSCDVDDDCPDLYECILSSSGARTCTKKDLFPISAREVVGTFVFTGLNALLTAGGVGAGAAYVPYIILLFQTTLSHSIYIAYLCVFGGGLGNLVNIIRLKNPKTNRYMTNYNLNMIILPALMIGVMIGMILQRIFPPLVTHLLLLMTLAYSLTKNYGKLKYNLAKERKERHEKKEALKTEEMAQINAPTEPENNVLPTEPSAPPKEKAKEPGQEPVKEPVTELPKEPAKGSDCKLALPSSTPDKNEDVTVMTSVPEKGNSKALNKIMKSSDINLAQLQIEIDKASESDRLAEKRRLIYEREQKFPWRKIREILVNIVVIVVIGLIRGSSSFKPVVGVDWSCGWDFLWFALAIVAYGAVLARCLYLVLKDQKEKLEVGYEFLPEEPFMDTPKIVRLVIVATIAGTIGAIVALGGSMIVGPTLLDFRMPPAFSSATTGVFMIFAMFNTTFGAILNQKVSGQELAWFLPLSFVCSYLSSKLVSWYIRRTGKQSVVIKCIMLVAALGFVCLLAIMIRDLVQDTKAQITFNGVC